jgi:hypothetical protein
VRGSQEGRQQTLTLALSFSKGEGMKEKRHHKKGDFRIAKSLFSSSAGPHANVAVAIQSLPEQKSCRERRRMGRMSQVVFIFSCIHALEASATNDVGCAHAARSLLTQIAPTDARGRI